MTLNKTDSLEKKWQSEQLNTWKNSKKEIISFFQKFDVEANNLFDKIITLDYVDQRVIFYLFAKIAKAVKICDFLDTLRRDNHEDVDAIKIFFLVCHAEIAMCNLGKKGGKQELVEEFFQPVADKYKLMAGTHFFVNPVYTVTDASLVVKSCCFAANTAGGIFNLVWMRTVL